MTRPKPTSRRCPRSPACERLQQLPLPRVLAHVEHPLEGALELLSRGLYLPPALLARSDEIAANPASEVLAFREQSLDTQGLVGGDGVALQLTALAPHHLEHHQEAPDREEHGDEHHRGGGGENSVHVPASQPPPSPPRTTAHGRCPPPCSRWRAAPTMRRRDERVSRGRRCKRATRRGSPGIDATRRVDAMHCERAGQHLRYWPHFKHYQY